jgi:hypothetical protein
LFDREQRQRDGVAGGRRRDGRGERREERGERRGERTQCLLFNNQRVSTVFPYALGNTVETQWRRLNIGLLCGGVFMIFSLFFPK